MCSEIDAQYMWQVFELAKNAYGETSPNPMVGALIVKNGRIIGKGFHHRAGTPHAEREAFKDCTADPTGATLYVNLEPCCIYGRTPPCTEAIIEKGIKRVVAAIEDPNPKVAGRGLQQLRDAGIEVTSGVLADEARRLNEVFITYITTGLPFVLLKLAMTLDGKTASHSGKSKWITSFDSRRDAHYERKGMDAVLIGVNTVLADDPALTVRHVQPPSKQPIRLVMDSTLKTPAQAKLVADLSVMASQEPMQTWIFTLLGAEHPRWRTLEAKGVRLFQVEPDQRGKPSVKQVLRILGEQEVTSVMIEGGATIAGSAVELGLVDKVISYIAPMLLGGAQALTAVGGAGFDSPDAALKLHHLKTEMIGPDVKFTAYVSKSLT